MRYHFPASSQIICSIFFIGSIIIGITSAHSQNALATSWTGYADTTTTFSSFFKPGHTISFSFMPQFPNASYQPIIAENGSGKYVIGLSDFRVGDSEGTVVQQFVCKSGFDYLPQSGFSGGGA